MPPSKPVILITGASTGIGKAGAHLLAKHGWKVLLHARTVERGKPVVDELQRLTPEGEFDLVTGDLSSLEEVRGLAKQVKAHTPTLDVLWNNAGLTLQERIITMDGWEMQMAINHLAPFLLTHELLPMLEASRGRVITTSSGAHYGGKFNWTDWMDEKGRYSSFGVYSKTKLANVLFTQELARRYGSKGITAHCYHPGAVNSDFFRERGKTNPLSSFGTKLFTRFMLSNEDGADTGVFLAESPQAEESNGKYWAKRKIQTPSGQVTEENARKLWELSEEAVQP